MAFSKRSQETCLSVPLQVQKKKNFSKHFLQSFRVTKCFYAIIAIKHDFLIHLHLLGHEGDVETQALWPLGRLGFQHLPRGPGDVIAKKIMFDPYIEFIKQFVEKDKMQGFAKHHIGFPKGV